MARANNHRGGGWGGFWIVCSVFQIALTAQKKLSRKKQQRVDGEGGGGVAGRDGEGTPLLPLFFFFFLFPSFFSPLFISYNPLINIWTSGIAARERKGRGIATIDLKKIEFHLQFQSYGSSLEFKKVITEGKSALMFHQIISTNSLRKCM